MKFTLIEGLEPILPNNFFIPSIYPLDYFVILNLIFDINNYLYLKYPVHPHPDNRILHNLIFFKSELSSYLNIPTEELLELENGNKNITLSILNKLCSLFGCSESYLLCRSNEYDSAMFTLKNTPIEADDLEGIASMNRIYMSMKYLNSKKDY